MGTGNKAIWMSVAAALWLLDANGADAQFLQTDPVGYQDDLNAYMYVHDDPTDRTDPTGMTCVETKDGIYHCHFDQIVDANGRSVDRGDLSKQVQAQIARFEKSYSAAVNRLASHPMRSVKIGMNDPNGKARSAVVKAGDLARALAGRYFYASPFTRGTGANTAGNLTTVDGVGLSAGIHQYVEGIPKGNVELLREIIAVHEGMHGYGTHTDDYLAPGGTAQMGADPYYKTGHQEPYDKGALGLLQ